MVIEFKLSDEEWLRVGMICMERFDVSSYDCGVRFLNRTQNDPTWERIMEKPEMPLMVTPIDVDATYECEDVRLKPIYFDQNRRGVLLGYCGLTNEILVRPA